MLSHPMTRHLMRSVRRRTTSRHPTNCHTSTPRGAFFVYNKSMEKQTTISLSSEQYELLLEMFSTIGDLELYDEDESGKFDSLWDAVLEGAA